MFKSQLNFNAASQLVLADQLLRMKCTFGQTDDKQLLRDIMHRILNIWFYLVENWRQLLLPINLLGHIFHSPVRL